MLLHGFFELIHEFLDVCGRFSAVALLCMLNVPQRPLLTSRVCGHFVLLMPEFVHTPIVRSFYSKNIALC